MGEKEVDVENCWSANGSLPGLPVMALFGGVGGWSNSEELKYWNMSPGDEGLIGLDWVANAISPPRCAKS